MGIIHLCTMFTIFTATFQQWNIYNSKYIFYIGVYQKISKIVKLLQHK